MAVLGILSDIHGNLKGLQKALNLLKSRPIDRVFICGDTVGYGVFPNECCEIVREAGFISVMGNHDMAAARLLDWSQWSDEAVRGLERTENSLTEKNRDWLKWMPLTYREFGVEFVHASLDEPEEFLYPVLGNYVIEPWQDVRQTFDLMVGDVCFVGHSHIPTVFLEKSPDKIKVIEPSQPVYQLNGNRAVIDVGSVGKPRRASGKASIVIYDTKQHTVEYLRFQLKEWW